MTKRKYDASVIVNVHNEGYLLHRTLKSLARNISNARKEGVSVETIIIADRPDVTTQRYLVGDQLKRLLEQFTIQYVDFGSPSLARNYGYGICTGEFAGNLDGDDLWSESYLIDAIKMLRESDRTIVVHPEYSLSFGAHNELWRMRSSTDTSFDPLTIVEGNWWLSSAFARREVFEKIAYRHFDFDYGFSYEDWLWNCDTLQAGYTHHVVPRSVYFYRRKSHSSVHLSHSGGLLAQTKLLTPRGMQDFLNNRLKTSTNHTVHEIPDIELAPQSKELLKLHHIKSLIGRYPAVDKLLKRTKHKAYVALKRRALPQVNDEADRRDFIPDWVKEQWRSIHDLEPLLFPSLHTIERMNESKIEPGLYSEVYWQLAEIIDEGVDYLIFTPWLKTGGADLVVCHYANTLLQIYPKATIKVFATENTDSPWKAKLNSGIEFIHPPKKFYQLSHDQQSKMLASLMVQLAPKKIHILNSQEAFRMIEKYASQIGLNSKLFLSIFAVDRTTEGEVRSAFIAHGEPAMPYVTKIFTDNEQIIDSMVDMYGFEYDKFERHFMPIAPISQPALPTHPAKRTSLRVLWAASIVKAKRPDILALIAQKCADLNLPIEFHVHGLRGESVSMATFENLVSLDNVHYGGGFQGGIAELVSQKEYDIYLCTSETEGTPNAILEAMAANLTVVAPRVGGIPEVISDGATGYLVDTYDDISQYVTRLKTLLDSDDMSTVSTSAREWIDAHHSPEQFMRTLRNHSEY
jgi:glycosyltransferase involved in cell wall biosynthesis